MSGPDAYTWRELARKVEEQKELNKLANKIDKIDENSKVIEIIKTEAVVEEPIQENPVQDVVPQKEVLQEVTSQDMPAQDATNQTENNKRRGRKRKSEIELNSDKE